MCRNLHQSYMQTLKRIQHVFASWTEHTLNLDWLIYVEHNHNDTIRNQKNPCEKSSGIITEDLVVKCQVSS